jgi:hypothetical protein
MRAQKPLKLTLNLFDRRNRKKDSAAHSKKRYTTKRQNDDALLGTRTSERDEIRA